MRRDKFIIALVGILVIGLLEALALYKGIDGTIFSAATAGVGAIVGYVLKSSNKA